MDLTVLKQQWTKESKTNIHYVENIYNECFDELVSQGLIESNPKFYPYLIIKVKKKLKIETNSVILKRFKNFLKEN